MHRSPCNLQFDQDSRWKVWYVCDRFDHFAHHYLRKSRSEWYWWQCLVTNISNCFSSSQTFRQHILYPSFVTNIDVAEPDLVQHKRPVAWWPFRWRWYNLLYGGMTNFILAIIEFEGWVKVNLSSMTIFHMNSTSQIQVIR